jgi:hypothetical protein
MSNPQEAPVVATREIDVRGEKVTYQFRELSGEEAESIFDLSDADGNVSREKQKAVRRRMIATTVTRADGSALTVEDLGKMRNVLVKALYDQAMEFNGLGDNAAAEVKNA